MNLNIAPGARILVRTEEWLVRNAEPSSDGGLLVYCEGISDLVRGVDAQFLSKLEDDIVVLDPSATILVADDSPRFNASLLYIESLRLRSTPNDAKIRLAHKAVMKSHEYQFVPARIALTQPRPRILIADTVGLGKTLEAGILATELIQRGRGKRILVITLKSMLTQFQKEWWSRFSIPLVRLDSVGLARVRDKIPANHNPFNYYDKTIISMDTLKNNLEYRNYLEKAFWDIIVIDECHNVAMRANDQGSSLRARLARLLSQRSDALILLSATPHDGSAKSFASLINLLDKTVIPDPDNYTPEDFRDKGLVVRRFKHQIKDQVGADFQERITERLSTESTNTEELAYTALLGIPFTQNGKHAGGKSHELQRVGMQKALFSSPAAAIKSVQSRISKLLSTDQQLLSLDIKREHDALLGFLDLLNGIDKTQFSKYQMLLESLNLGVHVWSARSTNDRIVLFSERIETLEWLYANLAGDLGLKQNQLAVLHGGLPDIEQQELVDRFGRESDPLRILLCSDVASEGLNLHYFCHRIVHFDMPWSLMTYLQRNGRVDRFGQTQRPVILYLQTNARNEKIRGDLRILEILQSKDEQANKNLGDPLAFLDVYDAEKEAERVQDFMAQGLSAEAVDKVMEDTVAMSTSNQLDLFNAIMASLMDPAGAANSKDAEEYVDEASLFPNHFQFAKAALELLQQRGKKLQCSFDETAQSMSLTAPEDLKVRLRQIPQEAQLTPYVLSTRIDRLMQAMESARQAKAEEDTWPKIQHLWKQHPISEWITDSVVSLFGGHKAPVIASSKLKKGEVAFVLAGTIPNRKGQPVVVDWQAARRIATGDFKLEPFTDFALQAGLAAGMLANQGFDVPAVLQEVLPQAVAAMRTHMATAQKAFDAEVQPKLQKTLEDLEYLRKSKVLQLELRLEGKGQPENLLKSNLHKKVQEIDKDFDAYRVWVHETMETEPQAFIQVVAAVHNL